MVGDADVGVARHMDQERLATPDLVGVELPCPLEGRVALGDEHGDRERDLHLAPAPPPDDLAPDGEHALGRLDYGQDVLVRLGGQSHHEVELELAPAVLEGVSRRRLEVLLGDVLVDDIPQTLRARLRSEGEAAPPRARDGAGHLDAERVEALRGNRDADSLRGELAVETVEDLLALGVVGRRERRERELVVAALRETALARLDDLVRRAFTHGSIGHARLAEPAPASAAAKDLHRLAVLDDAEVGHDPLRGGVRRRKVRDAALEHDVRCARPLAGHRVAPSRRRLVDHDVVERRNVDAGNPRETEKDVGARGTFGTGVPHAGAHVHDAILAVSEQHGVEGGGHRLAVPCRGSAPEDEGIVLVALVGAKGDAGKVKSLEDVGEDELVGEREADDVERAERSGALEGEQGHVPSAHERGHVRPGKVGALAGHPVLLVDAPVENRDAEVRLADLIDVGVDETRVEGAILVDDRSPLVVEIARGLLDVRQERLHEPEEVLPPGAHPTPPPSRHRR